MLLDINDALEQLRHAIGREDLNTKAEKQEAFLAVLEIMESVNAAFRNVTNDFVTQHIDGLNGHSWIQDPEVRMLSQHNLHDRCHDLVTGRMRNRADWLLVAGNDIRLNITSAIVERIFSNTDVRRLREIKVSLNNCQGQNDLEKFLLAIFRPESKLNNLTSLDFYLNGMDTVNVDVLELEPVNLEDDVIEEWDEYDDFSASKLPNLFDDPEEEIEDEDEEDDRDIMFANTALRYYVLLNPDLLDSITGNSSVAERLERFSIGDQADIAIDLAIFNRIREWFPSLSEFHLDGYFVDRGQNIAPNLDGLEVLTVTGDNSSKVWQLLIEEQQLTNLSEIKFVFDYDSGAVNFSLLRFYPNTLSGCESLGVRLGGLPSVDNTNMLIDGLMEQKSFIPSELFLEGLVLPSATWQKLIAKESRLCQKLERLVVSGNIIAIGNSANCVLPPNLATLELGLAGNASMNFVDYVAELAANNPNCQITLKGDLDSLYVEDDNIGNRLSELNRSQDLPNLKIIF